MHTVNDLRLDSIYLSLLGFVAVYRLLNVWRTHPIPVDQVGGGLLTLLGFEPMGQCASAENGLETSASGRIRGECVVVWRGQQVWKELVETVDTWICKFRRRGQGPIFVPERSY